MATPRPTRLRGAQPPVVPPNVGRGMESAYEQALVRLEATNSLYLRQKIAGLYTDKETERRGKARGERHAEKNVEEKPTDVASPRGITHRRYLASSDSFRTGFPRFGAAQ